MSERGFFARIPEIAKTYEAERWSDRSLQDNFEYAGHGGQNVVFRVKERVGREKEFRNIVLKADINFLKRGLIREAVSRWQQNPTKIKYEETVRKYVDDILAHPDDSVQMESEVKREQEFFRNLKKYFSTDEILHSRVEIKNVPVTPEVAKEILQESHLAELSAKEIVWVSTLVHYQRPIPETAKEAASFGFRYVERFDIPQEDYQRLNAMTSNKDTLFDHSLFLLFLHDGIRSLLKEARKDAELKEVLQHLVRRLILLTQETKEMCDLAGGGNLRVFKDTDGHWKVLIVDPHAGNEWTGAQEAAQQFSSGPKNLDHRSQSDLMNALNYARTLNGLAFILDVKERLPLPFDAKAASGERSGEFFALIQKQLKWPDKKIFQKMYGAAETQ